MLLLPNGRAKTSAPYRHHIEEAIKGKKKERTTHPMLAQVAMPVQLTEFTPGPLAHFRISITIGRELFEGVKRR